MKNNLTILFSYLDSGLALVPVNENKAPIISNWTTVKSTKKHIEAFVKQGHQNFGFVCGEMSGGLEVIDFDEKYKKGATKEWFDLLPEEAKRCAETLPLTSTKNNGFHLLYRLESTVDGNTKLAIHNGKTIIETRGVGGQVVEYPSEGYGVKRGDLTKIPVISQEMRDIFFATARKLDDSEAVKTPVPLSDTHSDRVGDVFNKTATWDFLIDFGWKHVKTQGDVQHWIRPDKKEKDGISATINYYGNDQLHVFSSNAEPFEMNRSYKKFSAYTLLKYNGDFHASAKALRESGKYTQVDVPQEEVITSTPIISRSLSDITIRNIDWLWERKIPKGALSMISGEGGVGKSQLSLYIASCVSRGVPFHESELFKVEKQRVLLITGEDVAETTIVPRALAAGADVSMIEIIDFVCKEDGTRDYINITRDIHNLQVFLKERNDVGLLIIDPISAYLGDTDSHNNAEVRGALLGLSKLAEDFNVAIIMINHLNKGNGRTASSRIMGSQAFNNVVRASYAVIKDDAERKFLPIKNNIGDDKSGLRYYIEESMVDNVQTSKVTFMPGVIFDDVNDEMNGDKKDTKLDDAIDFLKKELTVGAKEFTHLKNLRPLHVSERTLARAAEELGVVRERQGQGKSSVWRLPE